MELQEIIDGILVRCSDHPEWGIGSVERIDQSQVWVRFYAPVEALQVCRPTALLRHRYSAGDQIFAITEDAYGIVQAHREYAGIITYRAIFGSRWKGIPENNIRPQLLVPDRFDLLRNSDGSESAAFLLSLQARRLQYAYRYDELVCLSNARIELLPHQVFVADRVLRDYPHRFLLADEVGLGKTIEAGLILKELRARGDAKRVLVIVPAGLVTQWVNELRSKFNEAFTRIDSTNISAHIAICGSDIEQVWQTYPSIVTSLHMLRSNERYIEALLAQEWDLVIFDEAHHLRRYLERSGRSGAANIEDRRMTAAYRLAQQLQKRTKSLLLLTATPLQLHSYELFSLIELLDPALFPDFRDFEQYRSQIPQLNHAASRLEYYDELDSQARHSLAKDIAKLVASEQANTRTSDVLHHLETPGGRDEYHRILTDTHRLTRVLIRNRKRLVFDDLQPRIASMRRVEYSEAEWIAYTAVTEYLQEWYNIALREKNNALGFLMVTYRKILTSSSYALRQSFRRRIERLQLIKRAGHLIERREIGDLLSDETDELDNLLERYGDTVAQSDPALIDVEIGQLRGLEVQLAAISIDAKAIGLLEDLSRMLSDPSEKVLIFTQFTGTLTYLQQLLEPHYRVCVFYGDLDGLQKDKAVDQFRATCQVMIATESAGEGRNLQFCHIMINYDLPWNPMRIEQRIGRIDRIGQQHPVQIVNLTIVDTLEDRVLQVLHERIGIFESVIGALDPILESIEQDVRQLMFGNDGATEARTIRFEQRVIDRAQEVQRMEERLADLILDASSFRRDRADALLGRRPAFTGDDLRRFLTQFLAGTGGKIREHAANIYDITPPRSLYSGAQDNLRDSYRVTFDSAVAQRQERLDFVAFGHPILDRAVEMCLGEAFGGSTAHLAIPTDTYPPQSAIVAIYEFVFEGVRSRRQVHAFAVSLTGEFLLELSEQFLAIAVEAKPMSLSIDELKLFSDALDGCRNRIESEVTRTLQREQQIQNTENRREYDRTYSKLDRYYAANHLSLTREIALLQELATAQQLSADANDRRIAPATQGRVAAAIRDREQLAIERDSRLSGLGKKRTVVAAEELLSIAYVILHPRNNKDNSNEYS